MPNGTGDLKRDTTKSQGKNYHETAGKIHNQTIFKRKNTGL